MDIHDFILSRLINGNPELIGSLLNRFQSSKRVLESSSDEIQNVLKNSGKKEREYLTFIKRKEAYEKNPKEYIGKCNRLLDEIRRNSNVNIITISDKEYPHQLREIVNPPLTLYYKGNLDFDFEKSIAIVGTRNYSQYGLTKTREISKELARRKYCIISGLARGIDSGAHTGTLEVGGKTIAVLALGLRKIYPSEHENISKEIVNKGGALISEIYDREMLYEGDSNISREERLERGREEFKRRNRIISGLSKSVLIVEGSYKSGSLSQYNHAKRQKRTVFTLKPIKEHGGAFLPKKIMEDGHRGIETARDIIESLDGKAKEKKLDSFVTF